MIDDIQKLQDDLTQLLQDVCTYQEKPNKSISGRIRKQLGDLKKEVTPLRATLVARDRDGYK